MSAERSTVGLQQLGRGAPDYEATESMVSVESHGSALSSSTEGQSELSYGRNSLNLGDIRHRASSEQGLELKLASGLIYHEEDDIVEGDETKESGEGEEGGGSSGDEGGDEGGGGEGGVDGGGDGGGGDGGGGRGANPGGYGGRIGGSGGGGDGGGESH